ncbi:hypothetical protein [Deinococcus sp. QL22]|uniref:hypothetical protein n=1 Tax=Deinococcus sp. QL22 TaxID=2939437 RepID=UPI0020176540|nr:hypothetical protein [Deinococcus sp. QL22]UQN10772.1 hypothetical protein M1R55_31070 [Deinococcus sp. QL22]UQN10818.1 hypothetical protein M1R55_31325 [Deinococcus sp. QL22]
MYSASPDSLPWPDLVRIYGHTPRLLAGGALRQGLSVLDTVRLLCQTKGLPILDAKRLATEEHTRFLASPHTEWMKTLTQELQGRHQVFPRKASTLETDDLATLWPWSGGAHVLARLGHFPSAKATQTPVYRVSFMPFSSQHFAVSFEWKPQPHVHFVGTKPFSLLPGGALIAEEQSAMVFDPWIELAVWTEQGSGSVNLFQEVNRVSARLLEPTVPRVGYGILDGVMTQAEAYEGHRVRAIRAHCPTLTHHPGQVAFFQLVLRAAGEVLKDPRTLAVLQEAQQSLLWDG